MTLLLCFLREKPILVSKRVFKSIPVLENRPTLAPLAGLLHQKFLFVAYTRVQNKRLFSAAANITDERRKRLMAQRAEIPVFLESKLAFISQGKNRHDISENKLLTLVSNCSHVKGLLLHGE